VRVLVPQIERCAWGCGLVWVVEAMIADRHYYPLEMASVR
jgi:hypothetical protein